MALPSSFDSVISCLLSEVEDLKKLHTFWDMIVKSDSFFLDGITPFSLIYISFKI